MQPSRDARVRRSSGQPGICLLLTIAALAAPGPGAAQSPVVGPAEALILQEQTRAAVQEAFAVYYERGDGALKNDNLVRGAEMLVELGDAAVPFLAIELEQALPYNYIFVAYALGRIGTPEAELALRDAVESAEETDNEFGNTRKAWACLALAMMGQVDALELSQRGRHRSGAYSVYQDMSMLEVGALLTAPDSIAPLQRMLKWYPPEKDEDEEAWRYRSLVVSALGRVADAASIPLLIDRLKNDPEASVRRAAADVLHRQDAPEVSEALLRRLTEESLPHVRYMVAWSLEQILPPRYEAFVERLETEDSVAVRGVLYRIVTKLGGVRALTALRPHLGRPDSDDRRDLILALSSLSSPQVLAPLRAALADPTPAVQRAGAAGLTRIGDRRAREVLLGQVPGESWPAARAAIEGLTLLGEGRMAPLLVERLQRQELADVIRDPLIRERVYRMAGALLSLRYTAAMEPLRPFVARQRDGMLILFFQGWQRKLERIRDLGDDVTAWARAADDDDEEMRRLAYERLAEIGGDEAARALAARFGRVEVEEGQAILAAASRIDAPATRALLARVLVSPDFDTVDRTRLRDTAAWGARRLGGPDLLAALRESGQRRQGRDALVMIYLGLAGSENDLEFIQRIRTRRLIYPKWTRARELELLDSIVRERRAGRHPDAFEAAPEHIGFHRADWAAIPLPTR